MISRLLFPLAFVFLFGCGSEQPSDNKSESQGDNQSNDQGELKIPALTKDGRWVFSLSNNQFKIKGLPLPIERANKIELEKMLGPADRLVDLEESPYEVALWDRKGLRAYVIKRTGKVRDFDMIFVPSTVEGLEELEPRAPFNGVLMIEGIEITKTTTKEMLQKQGRLSQNLVSDSYIRFHNYNVTLDRTKDGKTLTYIRISMSPRPP
jgi:hypothetical protein